MGKQELQIGETVYFIDDDMRFYEETIRRISLSSDGNTIEYETVDGFEFTKEEINNTVFKSKENRESCLMNLMLN